MTTLVFNGGVLSIGAFSSANRYIRQPSNPAAGMFYMIEGPGLVVLGGKATQAAGNFGWRYVCGPLQVAGGNTAYDPGAGFNLSRLIAL